MASEADSRIARRTVLRRLGMVAAATVLLSETVRAEVRPLPKPVPPRLSATPPRKPGIFHPVHPHVVVVDPGHGGIDPGTIGVSGVYEKEITLSVARQAARRLEASKRYRVVMTRQDDQFVELRERVARARLAKGDLFLSIHADALPDPEMRGASVFTLSEKASDRLAAALAARENKADLIAGIDLSRQSPEISTVLFELERRENNNLSIGFARRLVHEIGREAVLLGNCQRSAGFAVLKAPDIPSALVELGCLSNREEDRLLRSPAYQQKLAASLVRSVDDFFDHVVRG
jgi:N-acetylmuramoyl-L-alanine amidase